MPIPHRSLVMTEAQHNRITTLCGHQRDLVDLLKQAPLFTPSTKKQRDAATKIHVCEEVEIDPTAGVSEADEGYWVQAWVWVQVKTAEDE